MEAPGAGLDDRTDGGSRRQPVFGAVVGSQLAELRNRVFRRHDDCAAATSPIVDLSPVQQPQVVGYAHPVKADVRVAAHGRGNLKIRLQAGRSRREVSQRIEASPIRFKLGNLLSGDHVADLSGLGLQLYVGNRDRYRLLCLSDLHSEIEPQTIADIEHQAVFVLNTEATRFGFDVIEADGKIRQYVLAGIRSGSGASQAGGDGGCRNGRVWDH